LEQLYDTFKSTHVHVLDDLLHQTIFEKTGIKLDHVLAVPSKYVFSQIVEQLLPLFLLDGVNRFHSKYILVSTFFVDSSANYSRAATPQGLAFLHIK